MFVRNVITTGYKNAIQIDNKAAVNSVHVDEFVSGPVLSLREGQIQKSLNLAIEELPDSTWESDFKNWANVDDYGAKGDGKTDDSAAIQAAFNSGKAVVYFPKAVYKFSSAVSVPSGTRHIMGFYGSVNGQLIIEKGTRPLLMEDFGQRSETVIKRTAKNFGA